MNRRLIFWFSLDRPPKELTLVTVAKRSKKEVKEDAIMFDLMVDAEDLGKEEEIDRTQGNGMGKTNTRKQISFKESLLGFKGTEFNGVAYGASSMEEDPLISDLLDQTGSVPEPSEEIKKLMNVYPVVPMTNEEYNKSCQPCNNALIITVLGARFNFYRLKSYCVVCGNLRNLS